MSAQPARHRFDTTGGKHSTWIAVAFSVAVGLALTAAVELVRRVWEGARS